MSAHELITRDDLLVLVRAAIARTGSQKEFAKKIGVSASYLSDFLRGNRNAPAKVLTMFGVLPTEMYQSIGDTVKRP
jgi:DNA-binding transcriptional regulator YdaS (Cro superfamily)